MKSKKPSDSHIDRKVYDIVRHVLESRALEQGQQELESNILAHIRKLRVPEAVEICQRAELRLQRVKKVIMTGAVEKALNQIREEERNKLEMKRTEEEGDSDLEVVDDAALMDVKDTNEMNKSVVDLWKIPAAKVDVVFEDTAATPSTVNNEEQIGETIEPVLSENKNATSKKNKKSKKKDKIDRGATSSVTLADLGGIDNIVEQVLEMIAMPLSHPEVYSQIGSDIPRGVLLHGPPGCGKTMLANALANELGVPFINVSAPSVVSGMSGESEKKLREIFEEAKAIAPCLVFIDEIDAITPKRESVSREMERRIVAQLLTCLDDVSLDKTGGNPVLVIGATNRPDSIDAALRRGGRFDREICMNVPDQESRQKILQTISKKLKLEGDFDFKRLAKMTPGYVGADLNALVAAAGVCAIKRIFGNLAKAQMDLEPRSQLENYDDNDPKDNAEDKTNNNDDDADNMELDLTTTKLTPNLSSDNLIKQFLNKNPEPLTDEQLAPLSITFEDFMAAIPTVQPSSKREGFATVPDVSWDDVGAMNAIREELEYAIVEPIKNPELYGVVGITAPSGVLLWGPPGCGKTLLAKAVANESQANFISVRGPELLNKYVGESERAVRQVFVRARASEPCVIFFDELDALVPRRDDSNSESSSRVVNTLLTELDGVGDRKGVYVIAATNRPDMIDNAMLRPGRLDKQLYVELPTAEERVEILHTVTRSTPLDNSVDLIALAHDDRCRNFSGADLAALTREAAVMALKQFVQLKRTNNLNGTIIAVSAQNYEDALSKVKPSVSDSERLKYKRLQERLGYDKKT